MLIPKARRKTPLKKAPSNRARCQPNESSAGERARSDILAHGELESTARMRPGTHNDSRQGDDEADQIVHLGRISYADMSGEMTRPGSYIVECIGKEREGAGLESHCGSSQSQGMLECSSARCDGAPVISATKKAKEMDIVMMSRVLGLRLNAILEEGAASNGMDVYGGDGDVLDDEGNRIQSVL